MIDLYFFPTPNTWKVSIMLEECGLQYRIVPVNIIRNEQFAPEFLAISPNNRVPAIVDHDAPGGPRSVFESGAILLYLAARTGRFLAAEEPAHTETIEWLMWQMGGLGPMAGQAHHFRRLDPPGDHRYAIDRYTNECARLYKVLETRLTGRDWIVGDYGIADIACWGWIWYHRLHGQDLADWPAIRRWLRAMQARPAVQAGHRAGIETVDPAIRHIFEGERYVTAEERAGSA